MIRPPLHLVWGRAGTGHVPPNATPAPAPAEATPSYHPIGAPHVSLSAEVRAACGRSYDAGYDAAERRMYTGAWTWGFFCGAMWTAVASALTALVFYQLGWL